MRKVLSGLVPLAAVIVAGWLIAMDRRGQLVWDHWDEVKRGILYRSGQLSGDQLTRGREALWDPYGDQPPMAGRGDEGGAVLEPPARRGLRQPADARRRSR